MQGMNQFEFPTKLKTLFLGLIGLGVLCMIWTYVTDDAVHSRFWTNFLHNSTYFTGIAFMALFFYCANIVGFSGWYVQFKRVWEAYSLFLLPGFILILIFGIAAALGWNHIYHWADPEAVAQDKILSGKSSFLNFKVWFILTISAGAIWYLIARKLRSLSIAEDQSGTIEFNYHKSMRVYAAMLLPLGGFLSAGVIWLWIMSVDAHWYSTMFAWYNGASWIVGMMALTILTLIYLHSKNYLPGVTVEHLHDLGKYLFAMSIFWTYLWFSQYMLIWYANIGEETTYFKTRLDEYPVMFYLNLLINFGMPLLILLSNVNKRKLGTMIFVCIIVFFGHWMDFYLMLRPGILHTTHEVIEHMGHAGHAVDSHAGHAMFFGDKFPGFLEIGTMLGFLGGFLYFSFSALTKAKLVPQKDPYLEESLHHHV